jgi:hypothetical protein
LTKAIVELNFKNMIANIYVCSTSPRVLRAAFTYLFEVLALLSKDGRGVCMRAYIIWLMLPHLAACDSGCTCDCAQVQRDRRG